MNDFLHLTLGGVVQVVVHVRVTRVQGRPLRRVGVACSLVFVFKRQEARGSEGGASLHVYIPHEVCMIQYVRVLLRAVIHVHTRTGIRGHRGARERGP